MTPAWGCPLEKEMALQYSCLENPIGRGPWQATVQEVAKSQTRLSDSAHFTARGGNMLISSLSPP